MTNLDFHKLNADQELEMATIAAVKDAVLNATAASLPGYTAEDLDVVLRAGSVIAEVRVMAKGSDTTSILLAVLNTTSMQNQVATATQEKVIAVPNINVALKDGKSLQDIAASTSQTMRSTEAVVKGNCKVAYAVGIHPETRVKRKVPGYVDGPDLNQDDIDDGEAGMKIFTSIGITIGCILFIIGIVLIFICGKKAKMQPAPQPAPIEDAVVPQPEPIVDATPEPLPPANPIRETDEV
jgi:hypothetical protein